MTVADEQARVSLLAGGTATTCELCTAETLVPNATVVVQHARGGLVQLAACGWCVQAIRRLSAATGGRAAFLPGDAAGRPPPVLQAAPRGSRPPNPPVLIRAVTQLLGYEAGTTYRVWVYGRERADGKWEGWLEFVAVGAPIVRRTGRETTQSSREDLTYWASGLEDAYLQGAFARAHSGTSGTGSE